MRYTVGSLFAGVGGICLGFKNAKTSKSSYTLRWANEIDEYACETYRTNFSHELLHGDIEKIIHPTRIDENVEVLREKIKSIEEQKDKFISEIAKIKNQKNIEGTIVVLKEKIDSLSVESEHVEAELNILLNDRDEEFRQYLVDKSVPDWVEHQNKRGEFDKYVSLREYIISTPIDVLNGGFPCQAFSIAGEQHGFKDPRGNLFLSIVDLIELLGETHTRVDINTGAIIKNGKPRILFLENVKNLKGHDGGRTYRAIKTRLEQCGYIIFEKVLNTMDYSNLPQNRERIYIIGFRDESDAQKFKFFEESTLQKFRVKKSTADRANDVKKVIDYTKTINDSEQYYYTRDKYPLYFVTDEEFLCSEKTTKVNLDEQITEMYQFYQVRRGMYVRKNQSDVCPTLTANMGTGGHNVPLIKVYDGIRKITPEEAFRLQGFPVGNGYSLPTSYKGKKYGDAPLYKQAGNAVSVPIITLIAKEILKILEKGE